MRLLGKTVGKIARLVRAGVQSLKQPSFKYRLWQIGFIVLQAAAQQNEANAGGGGFATLAAEVQKWLAGSQSAALAIASILFVVGVIVKFVPGVSRRMREMGMETLENALFIVGIVAMSGAIFAFVVTISQAFGGQKIEVESPWK